jgi:hypothetical protein
VLPPHRKALPRLARDAKAKLLAFAGLGLPKAFNLAALDFMSKAFAG